MPSDTNRPDVAVFIDFENVYVSVRDKLDINPNFDVIMDRVADFGRVVIARAYADWYRYPRVTSALYANGIEPMYVPTYYYDRDLGRTGRAIKNSVDMNLCIDAMKTLYTNPNIEKFVLATGDRDFIPLVNSIRQQGKEVIIIGVGGAASAHLAQSADEFIFYEQLIGKKPTTLTPDQPRARMPEKGREGVEAGDETPPSRERERDRGRDRERERDREPAQPAAPTPATNGVPSGAPTPAPADTDGEVYDVLVQAVNLARERGYVCSFGSLKLLMKELMGGDFRESRYKDAQGRPFAKFKDFALEAERRGKVQLFTSGAVNEVFLPGEDPYKLSQFAQDLKEEPGAPTRETPAADRGEGRVGTPNGRRRRRRRGQRQGAEVAAEGELASDEELEDSETAAPTSDTPEAVGQADTVFEELLDRLEAEHLRGRELAELDPLTILDEPVQPAGELADDEESQPEEAQAEPVAALATEPAAPTYVAPVPAPVLEPEPFTDDEWAVLREIVLSAERPLSFQQIHDRLRTARNSGGVVRTNEELRTQIKQAIHSGMLQRQGKGSRATYRLAPPPDADQTELIAPPIDTGLEESPAAPELPELRLPLAETPDAPAEVAPVEVAAEIAPVAVQTTAIVAADEAPAETPAPAKRSRSRSRKKAAEPAAAAPEASAAPVADVAPSEPEASATPAGEAAPPKRTRRRRKPTDTPEE